MYDYFYHREHLFIVTELLRANLYEFQRYNLESGEEPYFTLSALKKISRQLLTSLEYLHSLALIHCALKPENILIKSYSRCEVKLIDFGYATAASHRSDFAGSAHFAAPEVHNDGSRTDECRTAWFLSYFSTSHRLVDTPR